MPITDPLDVTGCVMWLDASQGETDLVIGSPTDSDDFNRANSATTLGSPWVAQNGTWGVNTNRGYCVSQTTNGIATRDVGEADGQVKVTIPVLDTSVFGPGQAGLIFRFSDMNNWCYAIFDGASGQVAVGEIVGGGGVFSGGGGGYGAGDGLRVEMLGSLIRVYRVPSGGGADVLVTTFNATNTTATKHGLFNSDSSGVAPLWRFDDWSFSPWDTPALVDTDPVVRWTDRSGAGNHAYQWTAARQPTFRTAIQNGLSAVSFDGVDNFMELVASIFDIADGTTFAVVQADALSSAGGSAGRYIIGAYVTGTPVTKRWYLAPGPDGSGGEQYGVTAGTSGALLGATFAWTVVALRANGTSKRGMQCKRLVSFTNSETGSPAVASLGRLGSADQEYWDGFVGEVIHYDRAVTDTEWDDIASYLRFKWALQCGTPLRLFPRNDDLDGPRLPQFHDSAERSARLGGGDTYY